MGRVRAQDDVFLSVIRCLGEAPSKRAECEPRTATRRDLRFHFFATSGRAGDLVRFVEARSYGGHTSSGPMRSQNRHFGVPGSAFGGISEILSSGSLPSPRNISTAAPHWNLGCGEIRGCGSYLGGGAYWNRAVGRYAAPVHASSHSSARAYVFNILELAAPDLGSLALPRSSGRVRLVGSRPPASTVFGRSVVVLPTPAGWPRGSG